MTTNNDDRIPARPKSSGINVPYTVQDHFDKPIRRYDAWDYDNGELATVGPNDVSFQYQELFDSTPLQDFWNTDDLGTYSLGSARDGCAVTIAPRFRAGFYVLDGTIDPFSHFYIEIEFDNTSGDNVDPNWDVWLELGYQDQFYLGAGYSMHLIQTSISSGDFNDQVSHDLVSGDVFRWESTNGNVRLLVNGNELINFDNDPTMWDTEGFGFSIDLDDASDGQITRFEIGLL